MKTKMKKKDIITLALCTVLIVGTFVFIYFTLFQPKPTAVVDTAVTNRQDTITGELDEVTLKKINELKKYVSTNLDNIGRTDPFGPLK